MIRVDCSRFAELKVELAGYISEKLEGAAIALVQSTDIVIDWLSDSPQYRGPDQIISIIRSFLAAENLSAQYELDSFEDFIGINPRGGIRASKKTPTKQPGLPPNVLRCAHCGYITSDEFALRLHERLHYLRF